MKMMTIKLYEPDMMHLRALKKALGDSEFQRKYPGLDVWSTEVDTRNDGIVNGERSLANALNAEIPERSVAQALDDLRISNEVIAAQKNNQEGGNTTNYHVNISHVTGPVNVLSHLNNAVQTVQAANGIKQSDKDQISTLLKDLQTSLESTPTENLNDAELVAEQASALADECSRVEPRKAALKIKADGLIEAANALKSVVPAAIEIAKKIAAFIVNPIA